MENSGNSHPSVFRLDGNTASGCIINSCLAFIHCHMAVRDKTFIKGKTCSAFTLEQLKEARERVFRYCEPNKSYGYKGPQGKSDREKACDAFDGIYAKLVKMDAENKMPVLSAPSSDLLNLLTTQVGDHGECDGKFQKLEKDLDELKQTFHSFVAVVTSPQGSQAPQPSKTVPPLVRNRLLSTGSKRSASEISDEDEDIEVISQADPETNDTQGFQLPRKQRQKLKRSRILSNEGTKPAAKYSSILKKPKEKPPSTWGKAKATSSFRGAVPDIFLYNLDFDVTTQDIVDHFSSNDVVVRKICKKSHKDAQRTSFQLSVATQDNYDLILEGSLLPEGVAARRFIPPKWNPDSEKSKITKGQLSEAMNSTQIQNYLKELDELTSKGNDHIEMDTNVPHANNTTNNG